MHNTKRVPRPGLWSLMLVAVIGFAWAGQIQAQQPPPPPPTPTATIVAINITKEIPVPSGKKIKSHAVDKAGIVEIGYSADLTKLLVTGVAPGVINLTIVDVDNKAWELRLFVQADVEFLRAAIRQAVPTANVEPIAVGKDTFILTGTVSKASDIPVVLAAASGVVPNAVNAMRVGGVMQVQLDVLIAQVSRNELRSMAFNWFYNDGSTFIGSVLQPSNASATSTLSKAAANTSILSTANIPFGIVSANFFGYLQALRTEGLAKFLACPKLVTLSGKPAQFQSGGQLAVPQPSGLGTTAVDFKDFGTELNFLPIVMGDGKIYLEVEPIVTNVNAALGTTIQGTVVPGFDKQYLHASVEMEAGQTFAIGGLIQTAVNATTVKVPVLGDLPFVGTAFRTVSHNHTETELLILVTPYLVDPLACNQLGKMVPGQETRIPDDFELFLEGILEAPRGQRHVFDGIKHRAAYLNGPSAEVFPCGVGPQSGHGGWGNRGSCGNGGCSSGTCGNGGCTNGTCGNGGAYPVQSQMAMPAPMQTPLAVPAGTPPRSLPAGAINEVSQPLPSGVPEVTLPTSTPVDLINQVPVTTVPASLGGN